MTEPDLTLAPGISTCIVRPNKFEPVHHLPMIADAGFRCIELNCNNGSGDFSWDRPRMVRNLQRTARQTGVAICAVHAEGAFLPPPDPARRRVAVDLARTFADLAAELGAPVVTIHAGLPPGVEHADAMAILRDTLAELQEHALSLPCRFGWENEARGLDPAEHGRMLHDLDADAFGFVLDTGHANMQGTTPEHLRHSGDRLLHLHLNDNDGTRDQHILPGAGTVDWPGFAAYLAQVAYTGPLMLEALARERQDELETVLQEAAASLRWLQDGRRDACR